MTERLRGQWYQDGDWFVRHEKTTKPFGRVRTDATHALMLGLTGLFATHEWRGPVLRAEGLGAVGILTYEEGEITCKVHLSFPATFFQSKVMSDVEAVMIDVAGVPAYGTKDVFVVHGHNGVARQQLKDLLTGFGLRPIVLAEQNDMGLTIVEKFEYYAATCSFAFVVMTPDDRVAGDADTTAERLRARQNVILELGWFMARLGRERVAILHQGDLDIPSDILGVIFMPFEASVSELAPRIAERLREAGVM